MSCREHTQKAEQINQTQGVILAPELQQQAITALERFLSLNYTVEGVPAEPKSKRKAGTTLPAESFLQARNEIAAVTDKIKTQKPPVSLETQQSFAVLTAANYQIRALPPKSKGQENRVVAILAPPTYSQTRQTASKLLVNIKKSTVLPYITAAAWQNPAEETPPHSKTPLLLLDLEQPRPQVVVGTWREGEFYQFTNQSDEAAFYVDQIPVVSADNFTVWADFPGLKKDETWHAMAEIPSPELENKPLLFFTDGNLYPQVQIGCYRSGHFYRLCANDGFDDDEQPELFMKYPYLKLKKDELTNLSWQPFAFPLTNKEN